MKVKKKTQNYDNEVTLFNISIILTFFSYQWLVMIMIINPDYKEMLESEKK